MRSPGTDVLERAVDAVRHGFGLDIDDIEPIPTWNSAVLRLRSGGHTYALRVHEPDKRHPDRIRGELEFLRHLRTYGLRVPEPLRTSGGEDLLVDDASYYDITTWLGGVVRRDGLEASDAHRLGETLARIHAASSTFSGMPERRPPEYDELWFIANASADDVRAIASYFAPADVLVLEQALAKVRPTLAALDADELTAATLHKDFILGNCLWSAGELSVIDFAEAAIGPLLYDFAPMLTNIGDEPHLRSAFLAGYRSVRPLSARQEAALPLLEAVRHISSCFSMISRARRGLYGPALDVHLPYRVGEVRGLLPLIDR